MNPGEVPSSVLCKPGLQGSPRHVKGLAAHDTQEDPAVWVDGLALAPTSLPPHLPTHVPHPFCTACLETESRGVDPEQSARASGPDGMRRCQLSSCRDPTGHCMLPAPRLQPRPDRGQARPLSKADATAPNRTRAAVPSSPYLCLQLVCL
jgi:hypothetical protein